MKTFFLECVAKNDEAANSDMTFRATVLVRDTADDEWTLVDLFESDDLNYHRALAAGDADDVTHVRRRNADGSTTDVKLFDDDVWTEALRLLKWSMKNWAESEGVHVKSDAKPASVVEAVMAERARRAEREAAEARQEAERARAAQDAETRARARQDFALWAQDVRANFEYGSPERCLLSAVDSARHDVENWPAVLAEHTRKLAEAPTHHLGWSGDFVQTAATYEVARWLVDAFNEGATAEDLANESMRQVLRASSSASRSTSVMSNLVDDCQRVAWTKVAQRLNGSQPW